MAEEQDFNFDSVDWGKLEQEASEAFGPTHVPITPAMLAKRLLWDTVPCDHAVEVARYLGMPPASDDVEKMEHDESHARLNGARLTAPYVNAMAKHAAEAIAGSMIVGHGHADHVSAEDRQETSDKLEAVIFMASLSIIAELLDVGILRYPPIQFAVIGGQG